jgi:hypothetical protein
MLSAGEKKYISNRKGPQKVIIYIITLWSYLFRGIALITAIAFFLTALPLAARATEASLESAGAGSNGARSPGFSYSKGSSTSTLAINSPFDEMQSDGKVQLKKKTPEGSAALPDGVSSEPRGGSGKAPDGSSLERCLIPDEAALKEFLRPIGRVTEAYKALAERSGMAREDNVVYRGMRLERADLDEFLHTDRSMTAQEALWNKIDASRNPGEGVGYSFYPWYQSTFPRTNFYSVVMRIDEAKGNFIFYSGDIRTSQYVPPDAILNVFVFDPAQQKFVELHRGDRPRGGSGKTPKDSATLPDGVQPEANGGRREFEGDYVGKQAPRLQSVINSLDRMTEYNRMSNQPDVIRHLMNDDGSVSIVDSKTDGQMFRLDVSSSGTRFLNDTIDVQTDKIDVIRVYQHSNHVFILVPNSFAYDYGEATSQYYPNSIHVQNGIIHFVVEPSSWSNTRGHKKFVEAEKEGKDVLFIRSVDYENRQVFPDMASMKQHGKSYQKLYHIIKDKAEALAELIPGATVEEKIVTMNAIFSHEDAGVVETHVIMVTVSKNIGGEIEEVSSVDQRRRALKLQREALGSGV